MHPVALAVRGMVKLPTGSADKGAGTGKMDAQFDFIVSKEVASVAEISAASATDTAAIRTSSICPTAFRSASARSFPRAAR